MPKRQLPALPALAAAFLPVLILSACGGKPVYRQESFDPKAPYQYRIPISPNLACDAAKFALLSQGYAADVVTANQLKGNKSFQPDSDRHVIIDFAVHCASTRMGTMLYANATESRYDLKKTTQSAGINIASVGGITVPWGSSSESLVKVAGHTIDDPQFYKRFYDLVDQHLGIASQRAKE